MTALIDILDTIIGEVASNPYDSTLLYMGALIVVIIIIIAIFDTIKLLTVMK